MPPLNNKNYQRDKNVSALLLGRSNINANVGYTVELHAHSKSEAWFWTEYEMSDVFSTGSAVWPACLALYSSTDSFTDMEMRVRL